MTIERLKDLERSASPDYDACGGILRPEGIQNRIHDCDAVIARYEGPKGGPGMREMHGVTAALVGQSNGITAHQ